MVSCLSGNFEVLDLYYVLVHSSTLILSRDTFSRLYMVSYNVGCPKMMVGNRNPNLLIDLRHRFDPDFQRS